ncbi:aconitase/3-isopropylmalate dehydratase large subunit family protein [Cupriavidus pauculus]|uniref:3-isopropylmalate dehydratase large subunit n=1 Tax=Cupriavidus pauculus TaxID=82633 RepID=UPI001EE32EE9|nr:aconitase/3-isopropylmalate dehydratase large subunit family protein [Cupriavidus pauculus]GJG98495.1 homoaconitate hydratase family protein [Cupriavidus pauculus]
MTFVSVTPVANTTPRGQTLAEKLLSRSAGQTLYAGDVAICEPDAAMGTDGSIPMALDYFRDMQDDASLPAPAMPERLVFALDHYGATSGAKALALQERARSYALAHGVCVFDIGEGIGHQLMLERGRVLPGQLVVGADSHAVSYGALNAFGSGIGSSDFAGILQCGQLWLKVPGSIRIHLTGKLPSYGSAKDLALTMARRLGAGGANYLALEFDGPGVASLDMDDRIVLANMSVEMGAKAGLFPYDERTGAWLSGRADKPFEPVAADANAVYEQTLTFDLDEIVPQVALPHRVDNVVDIDAAGDTRIDMVYLGTCTGGRTKDYREALSVLREGGGVAPGVRLVVTPASDSIQAEMQQNGMLDEFRALGAELQPPGCGTCCGTCGSIPTDGMRVLSTANRNFKGRMGNRQAQIFLASPRACATAAVTGHLVDPRKGTQ